MKKAILWEKKNSFIQCHLCRHNCMIPEGKTGICGVRLNKKGVLYSTVWGKTTGIGIDPIEKKPLFHFYPGTPVLSFGTIGCNFRCLFCQNYTSSQAPKEGFNVPQEDITPEEIIELAKKHDCQSIAYTYNEPTIFAEYALDCMKLAKKNNIKNIFVSNGYFSSETLELIKPYLDAINIDLKSFNKEFYSKIVGAKLDGVLDSLKLVAKTNIWLEVTTLIIPTKNDSPEEMKNIATFIRQELGAEVPFHISAFFPCYKMADIPPTNPETLIKAKQTALDTGLKYVYIGNTDTKDGENTICPNCKKTIIKRSRYLIEENNIVNSKCKFCGHVIDGRF
ncbi:MAG: AmmeMemoRadiSam system radical SAM enzyme [Candidatus Aenigmarchaeota archaeon]|nr:AmmeMemoRadiSam system radical SAM enzyme [Candidatus Aenigmarchaeota archaeon]